jgi:hypothetical protein
MPVDVKKLERVAGGRRMSKRTLQNHQTWHQDDSSGLWLDLEDVCELRDPSDEGGEDRNPQVDMRSASLEGQNRKLAVIDDDVAREDVPVDQSRAEQQEGRQCQSYESQGDERERSEEELLSLLSKDGG